jgi:quinol monooxygenase YgiN
MSLAQLYTSEGAAPEPPPQQRSALRFSRPLCSRTDRLGQHRPVAIVSGISQKLPHQRTGEMPMFGVVATIKVKDGQGSEFEKVATELVKKVNENEKGCLLYQLYHGEEPNTYVFMERYADQAAVDAHRASDHFKTLGRAMGAFMDGPPAVKRFKQVGA